MTSNVMQPRRSPEFAGRSPIRETWGLSYERKGNLHMVQEGRLVLRASMFVQTRPLYRLRSKGSPGAKEKRERQNHRHVSGYSCERCAQNPTLLLGG